MLKGFCCLLLLKIVCWFIYKIDIYTKTAFYSQPIKNVLREVLSILFIYLLFIIIYLFKFYNQFCFILQNYIEGIFISNNIYITYISK